MKMSIKPANVFWSCWYSW